MRVVGGIALPGDEEDKLEEVNEPGPGKFVKAALVAILQALLVLFLAWVWWQGEENRPVYQIERMLNEQKK